MKFEVLSQLPNSLARTGILTTSHGQIQTPVFMPVGTAGIVKTLAPWEMEELGAEIILGNTYHLHVRPGEELINKLGGLHDWSRWTKPILTDSGGYQAYSLGETRGKAAPPATPIAAGLPGGRAKTTDDGVEFLSHLDGRKLKFTPENVLDIQNNLGSDIAMVLDDCPPIAQLSEDGRTVIEATKERVAAAVNRTTDWARRSVDHWHKKKMGDPTAGGGNALFGIIQGGLHEDLRAQSLADIQALPFDGIAVGGVAIESEGKDLMNQAVDAVASKLDPSRPHYLMGVGEPEDLIRMVDKGMDMFDCVIPTRYARHGSFWLTKNFQRLSISLSKFTADNGPLDPDCQCRICQTFSRSYLRHLFMSNEMFIFRALSYHNLHLILNLMKEIRQSINDETFKKRFRDYLS